MTVKYKEILNVYWQNKVFMLLSALVIFSAVLSKILLLNGYAAWATDFATMLFILTLWLTFYFGILLKRQFASDRTSLFPKYRMPHIYIAVLIFTFFVTGTLVWAYGIRPLVHITPDGLQGVYLSCFLAALLITYLGYLSIGRVFIYAYLLTLLMAINVSRIIAAFEQMAYLNYVISALSCLLIALFIRRLLRLKQEHFEYHYLLTWPPKQYIINQLKADPSEHFLQRTGRRKRRDTVIPAYPRQKNIFARAFHWDYTEYADIKIVGLLIVIATPLYLLFIKSQPYFSDFFRGAYSNFMLLSITPVLVTIASHYKKIAYWGYDLLKPVNKHQYLRERGIILMFHLLIYWLIFCICFAFLPTILFESQIFKSFQFWAFILLTGNVALLILVWLTWLSCSSDPKIVIFNGIVLSNLLLFLFYYAPYLSLRSIFGLNILCLLSVYLLMKKAYFSWFQKEFV